MDGWVGTGRCRNHPLISSGSDTSPVVVSLTMGVRDCLDDAVQPQRGLARRDRNVVHAQVVVADGQLPLSSRTDMAGELPWKLT
jgi:hypothetical protein